MAISSQIFGNLSQIASPFSGILLDAHGVFWGGAQVGLIADSDQAMAKLVSAGKRVGILSNSTQLSESETNKFQRHGLYIHKHYHFLITSGDVARQVFKQQTLPFPTPNHKFWLFGEPHPRFASPHALFEQSPYTQTQDLNQADFIYIAIPHLCGEDQTDPEVFRPLLKPLLEKKLPMVCANPDLFAQEGYPPRPVVRQGSIAKMYEEMGGPVFYIGKPHPLVYEIALQHFASLQPSEILMVGDTPETDIRGARQAGLKSALLTRTGIFSERTHKSGLEPLLQQLPQQDKPDYLIERLADAVSAPSQP